MISTSPGPAQYPSMEDDGETMSQGRKSAYLVQISKKLFGSGERRTFFGLKTKEHEDY